MLNKLSVQIGERIRNQRTSLNMPLDELAELVDLTPGYLGLIERGRRSGTVETLRSIANALNMGIDELFQGIDKNQINPFADKINIYLTYLDEDDCKHVLDVCKFLKMKNEKLADTHNLAIE